MSLCHFISIQVVNKAEVLVTIVQKKCIGNVLIIIMVFHGQVSCKVRAYIKVHMEMFTGSSTERGKKVQSLATKCKVSVKTVYRIIGEEVTHTICKSKSRKGIGGRKRILSERTEKLMIRSNTI